MPGSDFGYLVLSVITVIGSLTCFVLSTFDCGCAPPLFALHLYLQNMTVFLLTLTWSCVVFFATYL